MILYHGTARPLSIAEDKAILSPLEKYRSILEKVRSTVSEEEFRRRLKGKNIEEAIAEEEKEYGRETLRFRTISFSEDITVARSYIGGKLGVILGMEFTEEEIRGNQPSSTIYIPGKVELTKLREIYMTCQSRENKNPIKKAFSEYGLVFKNI